MLRPVDIAVLLKLTLPGAAEKSFLNLANDLHLSASEVHGSYQRSKLSGLVGHAPGKRVNRSALLEFLEHGLRYAFPVVRGDLTRGVPTAYAAEPLRGLIQQNDDPPPVWPDMHGRVRGYSFAPLYKNAASAALGDTELYELLSLADALRDSRLRDRNLAMQEIKTRIGHHA